jgi:Zn-dependent protease
MPHLTSSWLLDLLVFLPPLLFSLVVHEYAHARTALAFGDHTAYYLGRVTLNPLAHLDPVGTILIVLVGFGWAKPVPVNPLKLYPRKWGDIAVSLAGPLSNLLLAALTAGLFRLWWAVGPRLAPSLVAPLAHYLLYIATVNVGLCVFNLIPLFPLDGHHVVREILPIDRQQSFMQWQLRFGVILLMVLIAGPRLLTTVTNRTDIPDPLSWVFGHVQDLVQIAVGL